MNKLTIQINSLEALERLIGGDSQVEIEIRNSVVQNFADKHLKPLANTPEIEGTLVGIKQEIAKTIREKCEQEIASFKTSWQGSVCEVKLRPEIKAEIDRQVRTVTDDTIRKAVEEAIKFWANDAELEKRIANRFEYYTTEHINTEIKRRLEKVKASL
jgi:hypothetical protein